MCTALPPVGPILTSYISLITAFLYNFLLGFDDLILDFFVISDRAAPFLFGDIALTTSFFGDAVFNRGLDNELVGDCLVAFSHLGFGSLSFAL